MSALPTRPPSWRTPWSCLNGQFTDEIMSELTYRVDVEGRDVDEVAHEFLVSAGLLEE